MKPRPILLLEMNEIPWRVVDLYKSGKHYPNLAALFSKAHTFTTITVDDGELSPWITWPSFHRGMDSIGHGIKNLGQDPTTYRGEPIWEEYLKRGFPIGLFGSLQSWPPKEPGKGGFYVPDTFAHDPSCVPRYVEPFQKFNLDQVSRNGRVVARGAKIGRKAWELFLSLPRLGIRIGTLREIVIQLIRERRDSNRRSRRPVFQTIISWDIFRKLYRADNPPPFASFFTNHVAGVMHRYWHHVFPEDFPGQYQGQLKVHKDTMDFAMRVADGMVEEAMGWVRRNPDIILVCASSMGQAAVHRDKHEGIEASISGLGKLFALCGAGNKEFRLLLAMVPQVAATIEQEEIRVRVRQNLEKAKTHSGKEMFLVEEIGKSLSITIRTPSRSDAAAGGFHMEGSGERSGLVRWEDAGISMHEVEPGTGYHIPEGFMAIYRHEVDGSDARNLMAASEVKSYLMRLAGLIGSEVNTTSDFQQTPSIDQRNQPVLESSVAASDTKPLH